MERASAELDAVHDLIERAAPEPIVIVKVGVTLSAGAATAVTGRAIVTERRLAAGASEREQCRVIFDFRQRGSAKQNHFVPACLFQIGQLDSNVCARRVLQKTRGMAP